MALEDIEKKLYREKFERAKKKEEKKAAAVPQFGPWAEAEKIPPSAKPKAVIPIPVIPPQSRKKIIIIASIAFFLILCGAGLYLWYIYFPQNKVEIALSGPKEVRAGETISYTVRYKNNTRTILNDAKLFLRYPQGVIMADSKENPPFVQKPLGNIGVGSEAEETFSLMIFGEPLSIKKIETSLVYRPANLPGSELENKADLDVTVSALTLDADLFLPNRVLSGEPFNIALHYKNNSNFTFNSARVEMEYPDNFTFLSSDLEAAEDDNAWALGDLGASSEGNIHIKGMLTGAERESKEFKIRIGIVRNSEFLSFRETKGLVLITGLPLAISSLANDSADYVVKTGEYLTFRIHYKNTGDTGLKEVILKSELFGSMFDLRTVGTESGSYSSISNAVIWNAGNWPDFAVLEPGREGEVTFRVQVKGDFAVRSSDDKNFVLKVKSTIETPTVPAYLGVNIQKLSVFTESAVRIRTELRFTSKGYFRDPKNLIQNSGPLPPRVGQTTTYTIHWKIVNPANDLENVIIRTTLPPGISWPGKAAVLYGVTSPVYNERTGEVTWNISRVQAGSGVISPAYEAYFQVAATPSANQANNFLIILNETQFSGRDVFADVDISGKVSDIRSNLPDDPTMTADKAIVQE